MGEQSGGEQPPALPTTRARDAQVQANEGATEVRLRPHHFNLERHLVDRKTYKGRRSAALVERQLITA
jgi:hypothetical protein